MSKQARRDFPPQFLRHIHEGVKRYSEQGPDGKLLVLHLLAAILEDGPWIVCSVLQPRGK